MWPKAWGIQTGRQRILGLRANFPGVLQGDVLKNGAYRAWTENPVASALWCQDPLPLHGSKTFRLCDCNALWEIHFMNCPKASPARVEHGWRRWGPIPTWGAVAVKSYWRRERQFSSGMWPLVNCSNHTHAHGGDVRRMVSVCVYVCVCIILKE